MLRNGRMVNWNVEGAEFVHDLMTGKTYRYQGLKPTFLDSTPTTTANGRDPFPDLHYLHATRSLTCPIYAYRGHLVVGPLIGPNFSCPTCTFVRLLGAVSNREVIGSAWSSSQRHSSEWFGKKVKQLNAEAKTNEIRDNYTILIRPFEQNAVWKSMKLNRLPGCPDHQINSYGTSLGFK